MGRPKGSKNSVVKPKRVRVRKSKKKVNKYYWLPEYDQLLVRYKTTSKRDRDYIVAKLMPSLTTMTKSILHLYFSPKSSFLPDEEDIIQEAITAGVNCFDKFQPANGRSYSFDEIDLARPAAIKYVNGLLKQKEDQGQESILFTALKLYLLCNEDLVNKYYLILWMSRVTNLSCAQVSGLFYSNGICIKMILVTPKKHICLQR